MPSKNVRGILVGMWIVLVAGTELLLLVEARPADEGEAQWHVGFARFTNAPMTVRRAGRECWSCPHFPARVGAPVRNRNYFIHLEVERLPADLDTIGQEESK